MNFNNILGKYPLKEKPAEEKKSTPDVTVAEIHEDFNTASDKLYNEAISIIKATKIANPTRVEKLKKLGFVSTEEVAITTALILKKKEQEELANIILYYKNKYPLNRFITKESFEQICSKYDLHFGSVTLYKGNVPDSKLDQIADFKLNEEDYQYQIHTIMWGGIGETDFSSYVKWRDSSPKSSDYYYTKNTELIIAAPIKDFKIDSITKIFRREIKYVPDPIVCHPVRGGYLILAAWGEEASDPDVVNEINN